MFDFACFAVLFYLVGAEKTIKPTVDIPPLRVGQEATVTCTAPPLCSASSSQVTITWSCAGQNKSCIEGNNTQLKTENGTVNETRYISTLTFKVSAELHNTQVTCKVRCPNTTEETQTLSVIPFHRILNTSTCALRSDVLTCVCVSEGSSLPAIKWPLLENRTDYSVLTTLSSKTVNSTVTVSGDYGTTFECVSSIGPDVEKRNLPIEKSEIQPEDLLKRLWGTVQQLEVIIAFSIGFLFGIIFISIIMCLARKCRRHKQKHDILMEDLEMVTTQALQQDAGAKGAGAEVEAEPSRPGADVVPKEVEYSDIDFSMLKAKQPAEGGLTKESTETEYAEIKKEASEEGEGSDGEVIEEMPEGAETNACVPGEEEGGEEAKLYSNVEEIMDEM